MNGVIVDFKNSDTIELTISFHKSTELLAVARERAELLQEWEIYRYFTPCSFVLCVS